MTGKRNHPSSPCILLIGASGRAGNEIVKQLVAHDSHPKVHLFCDKSTDELHEKHLEVCASVYHGDSSRATDILEALQETQASIVILSIDNRDKIVTSSGEFCTPRAWAVVSAMKMPDMSHVRAIVLSSFGAGTSRIRYRMMGYGRLIQHRRRQSLRDHTGQEAAFLANKLNNRTVIIRTTDIISGKSTGKIVEFGDEDRAPSFCVDVIDVANYVTREVCEGLLRGRIVNITGH